MTLLFTFTAYPYNITIVSLLILLHVHCMAALALSLPPRVQRLWLEPGSDLPAERQGVREGHAAVRTHHRLVLGLLQHHLPAEEVGRGQGAHRQAAGGAGRLP